MPDKPDVWIIIPAFNEGWVIDSVLSDFDHLSYGVVVVDDGSSDDTARIALGHPVAVLRHARNRGQGAALQTGLDFVLRFPEAKFVVTFDADGQHCIDDIDKLLAPLRAGECDVAFGSRFLREGDVIGIEASRKAMLKLAVVFTRLTTGLRLTDAHNGFRAFTAGAASVIQITQDRMAHASQIVSQVARHRLRYCEVPVTVIYTPYSRAKGQSMLGSINILWDIARDSVGMASQLRGNERQVTMRVRQLAIAEAQYGPQCEAAFSTGLDAGVEDIEGR